MLTTSSQLQLGKTCLHLSDALGTLLVTGSLALNDFCLLALTGSKTSRTGSFTGSFNGSESPLLGRGPVEATVEVADADATLSLALSQAWGPSLGALGIIAALAVPYALLNLPVITWEAAKALERISAVRRHEPGPTT